MSPSVYDFEDYRAFLDAWLRAKRERSTRALATRLGVSPSYVSRVRSGARNLTVEHARHWATGMFLDDYEQEFFENLVRMQHGATEAQRGLAQRQVAGVHAWRRASINESALELWSNWYIGAIIELARCDGFVNDPAWVAKTLVPSISVEQAEQSLELLFDLGLLVDVDGQVEIHDENVLTPVSVSNAALSSAVVRVHKAWLQHGQDALNIPADERFLASIRFPADSSRIGELADRLRRVQVEIGEACSHHDRLDRVFELGVVLFPRSRLVE